MLVRMRPYVHAAIMMFLLGGTFALRAQELGYVDFQSRKIKALSDTQIEGYLNGEGMEMALAAELNSYPGPKHILDMKEKLDLTAEQTKAMQEVFSTMQNRAVALGKEIVESEERLNNLFAEQSATEEQLQSLLTGISDLQGKLRFTHLRAHLAAKKILTQEQNREYAKLRGYESGAHQHHMNH